MKLPVYLRQSWQIMLKDRQYSLIYITGVALSMAFVMAFLMYALMNMAGIYPEKERNRLLTLGNVLIEDDKGERIVGTMVSDRLAGLIREAGIPGVEAMAYMAAPFSSGSLGLTVPDGDRVNAPVMYVDGGFWEVFQFEFLEGHEPSAEWNRAIPEAVVSETMARRSFGSVDKAVGQTLLYGSIGIRVCGVVRDVPLTAGLTDAEIWLPVQMSGLTNTYFMIEGQPWIGGGIVCMLAGSRRDFNDIRDGIREVIVRYNAEYGRADGHYISMDTSPNTYMEVSMDGRPGMFLMLLAAGVVLVLLIPAVNLSGMVSSSMEERIAELGVRRAYGARMGIIVRQVLAENFALTLVGGLVGMVCARGLLGLLSQVLENAKAGYDTVEMQADMVYPADMFFRLDIYLVLFACVAALNVLSSALPVVRSLRYSITDSLNERR